MNSSALRLWLLDKTEYTDQSLPVGWPGWWTIWLGSKPQRMREKIHAFVLQYAGRSPEEEAKACGLSGGAVRNLLRQRAVRRMLRELGTVLQAESDQIASKEEILRFWTGVMRDDETTDPIRHKAAEALGKALGLFIEQKKVEHSVKTEQVDPRELDAAIQQLRGDRFTPPPAPEDDSWMT